MAYHLSSSIQGMRCIVALVFCVLLQCAGYGDAYASRGTVSSGIPHHILPPHRAVLIGDRLSWDSADYKLLAALESLPTVEEAIFLQVDEAEEDLLALQLRNFDPDTVLVSVRARTFERLPRTVLRIARSECRRRQDVVVLVFQLQAHAIPPSDRAFVRPCISSLISSCQMARRKE
jgi:hypothetical protein